MPLGDRHYALGGLRAARPLRLTAAPDGSSDFLGMGDCEVAASGR